MAGDTDFLGDDCFLTGETPFIGETLRDLLACLLDVEALEIDFGLGASFSTIGSGLMLILNPSPSFIGDPGLASSLGTKALKIGARVSGFEIFSWMTASVAAALLPLELLRSRPRLSSSFGFAFDAFTVAAVFVYFAIVFLVSGYFLDCDFALELDLYCLAGVCFRWAGAFLTGLFDLDFALDSLTAFAGVFDLAADLATLCFATEAFACALEAEALRADGAAAFETTDFTGDTFLVEGFLAEGWTDFFAVEVDLFTVECFGVGDQADTLFLGETFAGEGLFFGEVDFFWGELFTGEAFLAGELLLAGELFLEDFFGDLFDLLGEDFLGD